MGCKAIIFLTIFTFLILGVSFYRYYHNSKDLLGKFNEGILTNERTRLHHDTFRGNLGREGDDKLSDEYPRTKSQSNKVPNDEGHIEIRDHQKHKGRIPTTNRRKKIQKLKRVRPKSKHRSHLTERVFGSLSDEEKTFGFERSIDRYSNKYSNGRPVRGRFKGKTRGNKERISNAENTEPGDKDLSDQLRRIAGPDYTGQGEDKGYLGMTKMHSDVQQQKNVNEDYITNGENPFGRSFHNGFDRKEGMTSDRELAKEDRGKVPFGSKEEIEKAWNDYQKEIQKVLGKNKYNTPYRYPGRETERKEMHAGQTMKNISEEQYQEKLNHQRDSIKRKHLIKQSSVPQFQLHSGTSFKNKLNTHSNGPTPSSAAPTDGMSDLVREKFAAWLQSRDWARREEESPLYTDHRHTLGNISDMVHTIHNHTYTNMHMLNQLINNTGILYKEGYINTTFYREAFPRRADGAKPPVLLLHAPQFTSAVWVNIGTFQVLSETGYRAVAIDLPGYGNSVNASIPYLRLDILTYMVRILSSLGLKEPILVSPLRSGEYAMPLIMKYPHLIGGFVALAPTDTSKFSRDKYEELTVPTLVLLGERDHTMLGFASLDNLEHVPNKRIFLIANATQNCYVQNPVSFHRLMLMFLREYAANITVIGEAFSPKRPTRSARRLDISHHVNGEHKV
ncbi:predicted protein [Nematostella vectensis]|uniref:Uncharacterized protein n=1 Tax=Nematostella vectensis TaxID=45351 RepID=A7RLG8_NEMVE|nr:predicted protein [Nematostella vectensis]|eukprot:XP_001639666.1 predicted protein [Nematostella vectensis]